MPLSINFFLAFKLIEMFPRSKPIHKRVLFNRGAKGYWDEFIKRTIDWHLYWFESHKCIRKESSHY